MRGEAGGGARRRSAGEGPRELPIGRRRRLESWAVLAAAVLAALVAASVAVPQGVGGMPEPATEYISVQQGDTLWSIAESHPIEGLTTRQCVQWIAGRNGIEGSLIVPGQAITVPVGGARA